MKSLSIFWFAASAALLNLTSCAGDEELAGGGSPVAARITAGVGGSVTRAVDNLWEADEIGVHVTESPASDMAERYRNVKYATTASNTASADFVAAQGEGVFFQDALETVTFSAYAPYSSGAPDTLPGDGADGVLRGCTSDQPTRGHQKAFDYIYASGATASRTAPHVVFTGEHAFRHAMTRLIVRVRTSADNGFTPDEVEGGSYSLGGLVHEGTFDITSGIALADAEAVPLDDWSLTDHALATPGETGQRTFTAILYPQAAGDPLSFTAVIGGQVYEAVLSPGLEAGKSYTYTVTAKKTRLAVTGSTIDDWEVGGEEETDAVMPTLKTIEMGEDAVNITGDGTYIVWGMGDGTVTINGNATVILDNVSIYQQETDGHCILISGGNPTLLVRGTLYLPFRDIVLQNGAGVTIKGDGVEQSRLEMALSPYIGAESGDACGNITVSDISLSASPYDYNGSFIGANPNSMCGDITLTRCKLKTLFSENVLIGAAGGSSAELAACGDITLRDCDIAGDFMSSSHTAIGSGAGNVRCGDISIYLKEGQSVDDFLQGISMPEGTAKVGTGVANEYGTPSVGNINWYEHSGALVDTGAK